MSQIPYSKEAEESVIGHMLRSSDAIREVSATLLGGEHFYLKVNRLLFEAATNAYYGDEATDALSIAERSSVALSKMWSCTEPEAVQRVLDLAGSTTFDQTTAVDHADLIRRHSDLRSLLDIAASIQREVASENMTPDQIAGIASTEAMKVATQSVARHEIVQFGDAGREFLRQVQVNVALKRSGVDLGARFKINAIDQHTEGVQPGELLMAGGEPGVGKSAVWWKAGMNFSRLQAARPPDQEKIGTLILSLEMGMMPSSTRFAQMLTGLDGTQVRKGTLTDAEIRHIRQEWSTLKDLPLYLNYAPDLRLSQLRALVAEGIRKHNIGLVILDHFRLIHPDKRIDNPNQEDEEKVRFLKNSLAKDLNVAVVCLAHTTKSIERADKRPRLSDLRGSQMISAFADFVAFVYRPWMYADEREQDNGTVLPTDAEMIWAKNRHGLEGSSDFYFDPTKMAVL